MKLNKYKVKATLWTITEAGHKAKKNVLKKTLYPMKDWWGDIYDQEKEAQARKIMDSCNNCVSSYWIAESKPCSEHVSTIKKLARADHQPKEG